MADLPLANAVDAPKALFEAVGVPGQVVIHHQVRPLQVHAFPCGVVGKQHHNFGIVHEGMNDLAPAIPGHTPMDFHHGFVFAQAIADLASEVCEGVFKFGEQHQLSPGAIGVHHQGVIQDPVEFLPLGIGAGLHHLPAEMFQPFQCVDLELQLRQGLG